MENRDPHHAPQPTTPEPTRRVGNRLGGRGRKVCESHVLSQALTITKEKERKISEIDIELKKKQRKISEIDIKYMVLTRGGIGWGMKDRKTTRASGKWRLRNTKCDRPMSINVGSDSRSMKTNPTRITPPLVL